MAKLEPLEKLAKAGVVLEGEGRCNSFYLDEYENGHVIFPGHGSRLLVHYINNGAGIKHDIQRNLYRRDIALEDGTEFTIASVHNELHIHQEHAVKVPIADYQDLIRDLGLYE
ncbi:MAG: hypothetical protein U9R08_04880 [Nanoarchaeota archaeon]|nr:hypothetical protein [Nanoarchaeota archaeon]